jgi:tetratricopeptide (TPR) repeat protein
MDALAARELLQAAVAEEPGFALAHAHLARAWTELGYGPEAEASAAAAFAHAENLPRELRLAVEAQYREVTHAWPDAIDLYHSLWTFFPENPQYALRLAAAQLHSGAPLAALSTLREAAESTDCAGNPQLHILKAEAAVASSDYQEALAFGARASELARELEARLLLARARLRVGDALWRLGENQEALAAFDEALLLFRETGDRRGEASVLIAIGAAERDLGQLQRAEQLGQQALAIAAQIGDIVGTGRAQSELGSISMLRGKLDTAEEQLNAALVAYEASGDGRLEARVLKQRAVISRRRGELRVALADYSRSYERLAACGDRSGAAASLVSMAVVQRQLGELATAAQTLEEAVRIRRELGHRRSLAIPLVNLGNVELELGALAAAQDHFEEALASAREVASIRHQTYALFGLGEVAVARGELQASLQYHGEALRLRREMGETGAVLASLLATALIRVELDQHPQASAAVDEARGLLGTDPAPDLEAWSWAVESRVALALGELSRALQAATRAEALLADSDDRSARLFVQVSKARAELASGAAESAALRMEEALAQPMVALAVGARIEATLCAGECFLATGDADRARDYLLHASKLAEDTGYGLLARKAKRALNKIGS